MTDNEIIKALGCCGRKHNEKNDTYCKECQFKNYFPCVAFLCDRTIDLINRIQDEKQALINGQETLQNTIVEQKAEIERLKHRKTELQIRNQELQHEKSEAINEFAERLKEKLQWDVEFENKLVFESDIDNLVKEMTAQATFEKVEHNSLCETETYKGGE